MVFLAKMIGILFIVVGVVIAVRPAMMKKILEFWSEGNRLYGMAAIRIVFGAILLIAAHESAIPWLVAVIGLLPVIGGIMILVMGLEKSKKMIEVWQAKPHKVYRQLSIVPVVIGAVLILAL
jgi:hypothetical protein